MLGVYIHIPFCNSICSYCDFSKIFYKEKVVDNYLDSLESEIKNTYQQDKVDTIYIGGGTPSCLSIKQLNKLFNIINNNINLKNIKEYTIECNIESINEEKLILFKNNKVSRLSIGVESFNKEILKYLNRNTSVDYIQTINMCKKYFDNINIDLLYAVPNMSLDIVKNDLETFLSLNLKHLSYYSLILESHTKLYIDNTKYIDEDLEYEMYKYISNTLEKNNYTHYETSNYSIDGYQSKHNLKYWNNEEYYGFGLGASGYINNIRYTNTRSITNYLNNMLNKEQETITEEINMQNEMILGLRKLEGVNKETFYKKYKKNIEDVFKIDDLIKDNKLIDQGRYIKINKDYLYLSNDILIRFID